MTLSVHGIEVNYCGSCCEQTPIDAVCERLSFGIAILCDWRIDFGIGDGCGSRVALRGLRRLRRARSQGKKRYQEQSSSDESKRAAPRERLRARLEFSSQAFLTISIFTAMASIISAAPIKALYSRCLR